MPRDDTTILAASQAFIRGIDSDIEEFFPGSALVVAALGLGLAVGGYVGARHLEWGSGIAWVIAGVIAVVGLTAAGLVTARAERRFVHRRIVPKIEAFRKDHGMTRDEFVRIAAETLGKRRKGLAQYLDDFFQT